MRAVHTKTIGINSAGKQIVEAVIVSDDTPATLPVTGEGIMGMCVDDCFAPFSIIYVVADVPTKLYIANEAGMFAGIEDK